MHAWVPEVAALEQMAAKYGPGLQQMHVEICKERRNDTARN